MGVIVFKGKGKGNDIDIGQAFSGLEGAERFLFFRARLRQKYALTDDMVIVVQKAIDALESEIGHGQVIAIGIDQRKTDPATPGFSNGSNLGFIRPVSRFSSFQDHGAVRRLSSVFRGELFGFESFCRTATKPLFIVCLPMWIFYFKHNIGAF